MKKKHSAPPTLTDAEVNEVDFQAELLNKLERIATSLEKCARYLEPNVVEVVHVDSKAFGRTWNEEDERDKAP